VVIDGEPTRVDAASVMVEAVRIVEAS